MTLTRVERVLQIPIVQVIDESGRVRERIVKFEGAVVANVLRSVTNVEVDGVVVTFRMHDSEAMPGSGHTLLDALARVALT